MSLDGLSTGVSVIIITIQKSSCRSQGPDGMRTFTCHFRLDMFGSRFRAGRIHTLPRSRT